MNAATIDIIIPVYNCEKYIRQCILSIQSQIFKDFRIIVVDDGSTDRSGSICDELASSDDRIIVIHQPNGGVSAARNTGLKNLMSQYFCFVDSDDLIHVDYLQHMYDLITENDADIVVCGLNTFDTAPESVDLSEQKKESHIEVYGDTLEYAEKFSQEEMRLICLWDKLYKTEVFDGISFPEGKVYEDDNVFYKVLDASKRTVFTDAVLYEYRMIDESISHSSYNLNMLNHVAAKKEQVEYFHNCHKQRLVEIALDAYMHWIWWNIQKMKENGIEYKEHITPYMRYLRTAVRYLKPTSTFGIKKILKYWYLAYFKKISS
jgi:glycosyltransferase involved in cell wall biosynthesis